jgi:hypothetical protein
LRCTVTGQRNYEAQHKAEGTPQLETHEGIHR